MGSGGCVTGSVLMERVMRSAGGDSQGTSIISLSRHMYNIK